MNFVGHIAVALGHSDVRRLHGPRDRDPDVVHADQVLVGAALPDLAAMGRFRLVDRPVDAGVARGVDLHHRTDDLFHRHQWFRTNSSAVTRRLEGAGMPRGAARACGHVGVELLLDGHLLHRHPPLGPAVERAIVGAGRLAGSLEPLVAEGQRMDWRHHLDRLKGWPVPDDYAEPAAVAARLHRILSQRPRLAFDHDGIGVVGGALADQQALLVDGAPALVDDLLDGLTTSGNVSG